MTASTSEDAVAADGQPDGGRRGVGDAQRGDSRKRRNVHAVQAPRVSAAAAAPGAAAAAGRVAPRRPAAAACCAGAAVGRAAEAVDAAAAQAAGGGAAGRQQVSRAERRQPHLSVKQQVRKAQPNVLAAAASIRARLPDGQGTDLHVESTSCRSDLHWAPMEPETSPQGSSMRQT